MSLTDYTETVTSALTRAQQRNAAAVTEAAELIIRAVRAEGLVFTAGAGHSLGAVAETFYRAGGLAPVYPLQLPELFPLNGASTSTATEREAGLGSRVLHEAGATAGDVLVVFSNSGVNPYPVELASTAVELGMPVIAVNSVRAAAAAPRRADSTLAREASIVLDTGVVAGELSHPVDEPRTAAQSTITNVFLWNSVLATVAERAEQAGETLPLWRSSNVTGGDEANAALLERLQPRIPALR